MTTTTILLLAGKGTRLLPYTFEKPKCQVSIGETTLVDYQLEKLNNSNLLENLLIITGYKSEKLDYINGKKIHNELYETTNLVYSLYKARNELLETESVIISYGDIIYDDSVLNRLNEVESEITIVADRNWRDYWSSRLDNPLEDAKVFKTSNEGSIIDIGGVPNKYSDAEAQYIGLSKFQGKGVKKLVEALDFIFSKDEKIKSTLNKESNQFVMHDLFNLLVNNGERLIPLFIEGDFIEIDTSKDYEEFLKVYDSSKSVREMRIEIEANNLTRIK
ncbi:phosphocholine cytidylyltransferase family protein [Alkalicoccobacillus gibsonii]|uniref:phosphocholine cytidylyltransferase family protein n=1 Tax=Alkalicoccobacillus gibsonii TaxID=79881 RepID=UPI0019339908|nr:sugar phosphate nucleotidyltransferase [Alkalicoccobacillus gibsonii]MBM0065894.1 NTP transferase domain-containing protein [Alkalicoccobacillus gibsonii]